MEQQENRIKSKNSEYNNTTEEQEIELQFEDSQTSSGKVISPEDCEDIYPMKTISIEKNYYTAYELKRKYDKKQVILDSDFQRKSVWKLSQKRELIESILMGLPLPIFYFNEDKKGRLIVIDGRQRLTALFEFMDKDNIYGKDSGFSLDKLSILDEFNRKRFADLEPVLQTKIEDFQIIAHVIKPPTPERIMYDIFDRVNRAGTPLNKQEIRNALYQGHATKILERISETSQFSEATEHTFDKDKRMKDRYIILRFIAFYLYYNKKLFKDNNLYKYTGDVDEFLSLAMEYLNTLSEDKVNDIEKITLDALTQVCYYLGANAFRLVSIDPDGKIKRYPININIFETIMLAISMLPKNNESICDKVKNEFDKLKNSDNFKDSLNNHRDSETKVSGRYDMIMKIVGDLND